jgi:hypothetical protein
MISGTYRAAKISGTSYEQRVFCLGGIPYRILAGASDLFRPAVGNYLKEQGLLRLTELVSCPDTPSIALTD